MKTCIATVNPNFDEDHLRHVKNSVGRNDIPPIDIDIAALNAKITLVEVDISVFCAKLRKAAGLDNIPAEVLRNPTCVESLFEMKKKGNKQCLFDTPAQQWSIKKIISEYKGHNNMQNTCFLMNQFI